MELFAKQIANLSSKSLENTCEEVDFFKLQAKNLHLYEK